MDRAAKMLNVDKIFVEKSADGTTTVLVIVLASSIITYDPLGNDQEIEFHEIEIGIFQLFEKLIRGSKRP
jgi:hypothetical protein